MEVIFIGCTVGSLLYFAVKGCTATFVFHYRYQNAYMIAPIEDYWAKQQTDILKNTSGRSLLLAGDGRCDSPGFSAKYCTYSLMDTETNLIVHTETLKRSQVLHLHVLSALMLLWLPMLIGRI